METREILTERLQRTFSSIYHRWLYYSAEQVPGSLFETLAKNLSHIPATEIPKRVAWGGTFVNGIEVNVEQPLPLPCKLEYYEPRFELDKAQQYFPPWKDEMILFEDDYLIALFKPAKLPSIPGKEQKYFNLKSYVEKYTGQAVHMPSRLDMSTCGVILMSKSVATHRSLQRLYEYGTVNKTYLFGAEKKPAWEYYDQRGAIGKDTRHAVLRTVVSSGGKASRTIFTVLGETSSDGHYLLAAQPLTGRTHQIRVHAKDLGIPIIGDSFYDGLPANSLRLMAYQLKFRHPMGGKRIEITVPEKYFPDWIPSHVGELVTTSAQRQIAD